MTTQTQDQTSTMLKAMLTENTGRALLDSGDAYGRHWERNQQKDFDKEPYAWFDTWTNRETGKPQIEGITKSLYHFLNERLYFDADMQARFDAWVQENSSEDTPHLADMEAFAEYMQEHHDGKNMGTTNTYNGEDVLSQIIQYVLFEYEGTVYHLLQIHNGADARGGYTAPKVFINNGNHGFDNEPALHGNADVSLYCRDCDTSFDSHDAGYSFSPDLPDTLRFDAEKQEIYCPECGNDVTMTIY